MAWFFYWKTTIFFLLYIKYIHLNRHYLNECWLRNHFPPLDLDLSGSHTIWEQYKIRKMNLNFKIFALSLFIVSIGKMPKSVFSEANKKMYCTVLSLTELKPIVVLYFVCSLDWLTLFCTLIACALEHDIYLLYLNWMCINCSIDGFL